MLVQIQHCHIPSKGNYHENKKKHKQPRKENKKMARNMVTRTVHGTEVSIKVVDVATEQIVEDKVVLSKSFDDEEKLKKAVAKVINPAEKILVAITGTSAIEKCYGIPVAKFMELAVELDPKTRTAADNDTEVEAE